MRKSNFGCSSVQRQNVLKPRNTDMTPNSRLSSGVKKVRGSTEGNHRLSQITGRYTPTRSNIPRYTPVRNLGPSNNLVPPAPSSVSRLSVESVRNSSVGGKNRKETRPIGDPSFKSECIDKVLDFLVANGYNYEIHRRNLLNPSTKDFAQIFTFIYHHMNPTHTLPHKLEEEIPQLMKLLKYPNQLSKSTFISVGSRHTWPTVLAMLAWMIDIIGIYDISDPLSIAFPCDFDIESSIINKKVSKFFDIYECDDEDEVLKQHEEYYHALEELFEIRTQDMISQQEYSEKLDEEISIASRGPERLEQLQTQFEQLLIDKEKMECHIKEIQVHVTAKETEKAQLECTHAEFKTEASQLNEDQLKLEAIKAKQALSAGELARFKNHAKDVAVLITQLQAQGNEMDSQIWNLQMSLGKSQKELSDKVSSHNSLVTELELGEAFEIDCSNIADNMQYWRKQLISGLYESKKNTKHASYDSQSNKLRKDEELAVVQENLKEKKGEIEKLESKLRRVEEDITLTKSEILNEEKEMQQENERLHQQIIEARKGQKSSLYQKQYCVDQAKEELEATKVHGKERMILGAEFLVKVCNRTLEDLDFKTSATGQFKENVTKCCKELLVNTKNLVNVGNLMTNKCEK